MSTRKYEFTRRLGGDWRDLADALGIPTNHQRRFSDGHEARGIWEYLNERNQLDDLPSALRTIGRSDLVNDLHFPDFPRRRNAPQSALNPGSAAAPEEQPEAAFAAPVSAPRLPDSLPGVWSVAPRSQSFAGRDQLLVTLREMSQAGGRTAVHALHGVGGVGKTALVTEYAHQFAGDYEVVWWVNAEQPALIGEQLAGLAVALGVATRETDTPSAVAAAQEYLRGHDRWLVVFDNVPTAADIAVLVPQGPG